MNLCEVPSAVVTVEELRLVDGIGDDEIRVAVVVHVSPGNATRQAAVAHDLTAADGHEDIGWLALLYAAGQSGQ